MPKLHILGDVFCDLLVLDLNDLPRWGEDALSSIQALPGGSALNSAIHASSYCQHLINSGKICTTEVALFSAAGNDYQSSICNNYVNLHSNRLINKILIRSDLRTGTCIVISGQGDRCFITDRGCVSELSTSWFDQNELLQSDHLHIGGFYNCNCLKNETKELFQNVISSGKTTSLTPQYDASGQWNGLLELCPFLTFFIGNQSEAKLATHTNDVRCAAECMLTAGCKYVIITRGELGVEAYFFTDTKKSETKSLDDNDDDNEFNTKSGISISYFSTSSFTSSSSASQVSRADMSTPATTEVETSNIALNPVVGGGATMVSETDCSSPPTTHKEITCVTQSIPANVEVIDTTGAGDGFVGGFLVAWLEHHDIARSLQAGCLVGTAVVTVVGGSTECLGALDSLAKSR